MQVQSLNIKAETTDHVIARLKQGLPADSFDQLRRSLNISDSALSRIVQRGFSRDDHGLAHHRKDLADRLGAAGRRYGRKIPNNQEQ